MEREIATQGEDLPHAFVPTVAGGSACWCGREGEHEIHDTAVREVASEHKTIETMKGS